MSGNESEETWDGVDTNQKTPLTTSMTSMTSNGVTVSDIFTPEVIYQECGGGQQQQQHPEIVQQDSQKRKKTKMDNDDDKCQDPGCTPPIIKTNVPLAELNSESKSNPREMKKYTPIIWNPAIKMEKIRYPPSDLAKIPPDILLQLIRTGSLQIHTEDGKLKTITPKEAFFFLNF